MLGTYIKLRKRNALRKEKFLFLHHRFFADVEFQISNLLLIHGFCYARAAGEHTHPFDPLKDFFGNLNRPPTDFFFHSTRCFHVSHRSPL